jgi:hypothetical protein
MTSLIAHPFLLVLFRVMSLYAHNDGLISVTSLLKMTAVLLLGVGVLWVVVRFFVRDRFKRGLLLSTLLLAYFFFAPLADVLNARGFGQGASALIAVMTLGIPALLIAGRLIRTKHDLRTITRGMNVFAACAILIPVAQLSMQALRDTPTIDLSVEVAGDPATLLEGEAPDIYYIVLDGYGRADVLSSLYDMDNSPFLSHLRQQGFYVADASRANYCQTYLSIASSLNFTHLNELAAAEGRSSESRKSLKNMIEESAAMQFLRARGYQFVVYSSGYHGTEIKSGDVYLAPSVSVSEFEHVFSQALPVPGILGEGQDAHALHRERLEYIFDSLPQLPDSGKPKFVFAHMLTPHPPFIYKEDGSPMQPDRRFGLWDGSAYMRYDTKEHYRRDYKGQVRYITQRLATALDGILANSPNAVIVVQGDHGPGSGTHWSRLEKTDVWERMSILNIFHLPGGGEEVLYPEISPVNTFRVIFNRYFGTSLEMLPDESYYSIYKYPYRLQNVTEASKRPSIGD